MISRPLLALSIANALYEHSEGSSLNLDDAENSPSHDDSQLGSENLSGPPSLESNQNMRYMMFTAYIYIYLAKGIVMVSFGLPGEDT